MAGRREQASRFGKGALERARAALPALLDEPEADDSPPFPALHWMTAALFLAAGADTALRGRRGARGPMDPLVIAPLVAAPLAAAAHTARAITSAPRARLATQVLDGVAAGVAMAGVAHAAYNAFARGDAPRVTALPRRGAARGLAAAVAPLTFGATAALGLLLEHQEERERTARRRLERRARVVERLVPQRRAKLDRIVVHL